jgi:hypothetical protein
MANITGARARFSPGARFRIYAALACLIVLGCGVGPTPEDARRLAALEQSRAGVYKLHPMADLYLDATFLGDGCPDGGGAEALFGDFWMVNGRPRPDSSYLYLNLFDRHGTFCFQLHWDPASQRLVRATQPYY